MMESIYLPIAEIPIRTSLVLAVAVGVGIFSGFFGVGGGFLITPLLVLAGIPLPVVVGTQNAQILASSASAAFTHFTSRQLDLLLGGIMALGGVLGAVIGVLLFWLLLFIGQLELILSVGYIVLLLIIGAIIFTELIYRYLPRKQKIPSGGVQRSILKWRRRVMTRLPWRMRFPVSRLYMSILVPLSAGMLVGTISALMGIGGAVITIPLLIYLFRVPSRLVVGTTLIQTVFISTSALILQAYINKQVDIMLAVMLIIGGGIGAQIGVYLSRMLDILVLRAMLAVTVTLIAGLLIWQLTSEPAYRYSILVLR